jgi:hypothetical protein
MTATAPFLTAGDVVMLKGGKHQWIILDDDLPGGLVEITTLRRISERPGAPKRHVAPLMVPAAVLQLVRKARSCR